LTKKKKTQFLGPNV